IFHMKNAPWKPARINDVAQHIDLIPTLNDMLTGDQGPANLLAQSLLRPHPKKFFTVFFEGKYIFVNSDYLGLAKPDEKLRVYRLSDFTNEHEIHDEQVVELVRNDFKAAIQYFSDGMWDRNLYYPPAK
ncbi:MAG: hypothetical protein V4736_03135, partial [Bdellovibrionota bacterium]